MSRTINWSTTSPATRLYIPSDWEKAEWSFFFFLCCERVIFEFVGKYVSAFRSHQPKSLWFHWEDYRRVHMVSPFFLLLGLLSFFFFGSRKWSSLLLSTKFLCVLEYGVSWFLWSVSLSVVYEYAILLPHCLCLVPEKMLPTFVEEICFVSFFILSSIYVCIYNTFLVICLCFILWIKSFFWWC